MYRAVVALPAIGKQRDTSSTQTKTGAPWDAR